MKGTVERTQNDYMSVHARLITFIQEVESGLCLSSTPPTGHWGIWVPRDNGLVLFLVIDVSV